jgi:protein-tyrosine phosphatase
MHFKCIAARYFMQLLFLRLKNLLMKILMVCLGNICRSPLAEGILEHKVKQKGLDWTVESAGTNHYHTGEAPHHLSQKVARMNGIDICHQRARRFVKEDFDRYDRIYAMAPDVIDDMRRIARDRFDPSKVELLLNELHPGKNLPVPDPWYGPEPGYHEVYKLIDEACEWIVRKYGK